MTLQEAVNGGALAAIGGVLVWIGRGAWNVLVRRDTIAAKAQDREDKLAAHASGLAMELLKMTKAEVSSLKQEVAALRDELDGKTMLERRVLHFEEALFHIEQLLGGTDGREAAEHNARLFMAKMVAMRQVKGIAANAEQTKRAARRLEDGSGE